jgi:NADP-dependent 3-hydroxy acid dehydrogenase YdfG
MAERLAGTAALVTGASSGIGRATALELSGHGAAVALVARRRDRLDALAGEIEGRGGTAFIIESSLEGSADGAAVVDAAVAELGRLDTVINAAGRMLNGPTIETPVAQWEEMLAVNLGGLAFVSKAAIPHLLEAAADGPRGVADLVNISSIAGRVPKPEVALYDMTKFGVNGFSDALRQEFSPRNVRVSTVAPGFVATELFGHQQPATRERFQALTDAIEILLPEDIAEAIGYIVTRPRRVAINDVVIRPTDQV